MFIEETEDEDPGDPLSLDEIFSPHFAVRHFDSTWIKGNKRKHKHRPSELRGFPLLYVVY